MSEPGNSMRDEIRTYAVGYCLALALTGAAFALVEWPGFASTTTLSIVLVLALVQMVVHFRFFLHIGFSKASQNELQLILFSAVIIFLMVAGTLVTLFNLSARMM
jgi:cytochrome o ubiquinol oxidase subunit IV